jgi:hypothetical protein
MDILHPTDCDDGLEQRVRHEEPAEPQTGRERLAGRAGEGDAVRVERLERADGLPVVPQLGVVIVLDHKAGGCACPGDRGDATLGMEHRTQRELVRGRQEDRSRVAAVQQVGSRSLLVDGQGDDLQACGSRHVAMPPEAGIFHCNPPDALRM